MLTLTHFNVRHYGIMCLLGGGGGGGREGKEGGGGKPQGSSLIWVLNIGSVFCLRFNVILVCRSMKEHIFLILYS